MKSYVLGFLFTEDKQWVWLIRKKRPEWQSGKLNGIGGKIESGETSYFAMVREFREEAGIEIKDWKYFCKLTDEKEFEVYCYYSFSHLKPQTVTDEEVICIPCSLNNLVIPNLNWLIPMALSFDKGENAESFVVKEIYNTLDNL